MPAGANTKNNVGIRRVVATVTPPAERCFEINGQQVYKVMSAQAYSYAGNSYAKGASIPYDAAGGTKYLNPTILARDFNRLVVDPAD
jgi:hypothetical protein